MDDKQLTFPFSAVQGQPLFKLALLLATVNPAIGGVLIAGPRGCAKSTLARGVSDLLPVEKTQNATFVTLPLGATEEMLIGTLDLESVLKDKSVGFSPGLLKKAHGGVLYVDEVNLLPDHLVDQLLDVASSGVNIVERDGISHRHDARFTLIGTMNPDEGELRPQLQDRFGLMVELDNQYSLADRINIIKTRQAFDNDPVTFCDHYQVEQIVLQQQISDAQALLSTVQCSEQHLIEIATRCQQANVDGLRADIMMHRASLTHAAWCGRHEVTLEDIEQVAPLVLLHRQQTGTTPPSSPPSQPPPPDHGFSRPQPPSTEQTTGKAPESEQPNQGSEQGETNNGDWGAMPATQGEAQKTEMSLQFDHYIPSVTPVIKQFTAQTQSKGNGQNNRGEQGSSLNSHRPNWFSTLTRSLGQWPPTQLSFKKLNVGEQKLHLILLDTSASTLSESLSSVAKSVVMSISENAYLQRDKISVLGFGNDAVDTIVKAGKAPKKMISLLDNIQALGGTPLRLVLQKAAQTIQKLNVQYPSLALCCYLITDGRSRLNLSDLKLQIPTLLIDIEKAQIKRGRGKLLAEQLDAHYVALDID